MDDKIPETTPYEEAVEFRDKVESGEFNVNYYISVKSFLGLLGYMEQELEVIKEERNVLFSAHHVEMVRADEAEAKLLDDHEIAKLVNELTSIAKTYAGTEQMREHISKCVVKRIKP